VSFGTLNVKEETMRKFQLILAAVVVVATSGLVSYAVSASVPSALLTAGTPRYAVAYATNGILTTDTLWHGAGLSTTITIPAGKTGDVIVSICAESYSGTPSALMVRVVVGGIIAAPLQMQFAGEEVIESHCGNFWRLGVPAGNVFVSTLWRATNTSANLYNRSMVVTVNIH
jgi:hypothetical protein